MSERMNGRGRSRTYLNAVLTAIAVLLGMLLIDSAGSTGSAVAGTRGEPTGIPNAAVQRKRMIAVLERVESRVAGLEKKLTSGALEVKVVSMPEVRVKE